jgi:hypothetical protein
LLTATRASSGFDECTDGHGPRGVQGARPVRFIDGLPHPLARTMLGAAGVVVAYYYLGERLGLALQFSSLPVSVF